MADSMKEALHNTIHRHPTKGVAAIAEEIGMSESYLYRSALPDTEEGGPNATGCRFPLNKLIPLIRATGDNQVLDYINQVMGMVAVPLNVPDCQSALPKAMADAVEEFGGVLRDYAEMIEDFKITPAEAEKFEKRAFVAMRCIASFSVAMQVASRSNK